MGISKGEKKFYNSVAYIIFTLILAIIFTVIGFFFGMGGVWSFVKWTFLLPFTILYYIFFS